MRHKLAILVMAAGGSKRMGKPKQLLKFNNNTLLQNAINQAINSKVGDVILVLGANAEIITDKHILSGVKVIINDDWETGMAGSIISGLEHVIDVGGYEQIIIMLADQPFVKAKHLKAIKDVHKKNGSSLIVSKYSEGFGPPSLFTKEHFEALLKLTGDRGAKNYILDNMDKVVFVEFEKGNLDIDTLDDLDSLFD